MRKASSQKPEQGGQSEAWDSQGPCEEGFTPDWMLLGWFSFCVVFTSNHKEEAVQVPITSLTQVPTTLLIYYGQGDRVAGVTLPWTREETPLAVSLLLLRPRWALGAAATPPGVQRGCLECTGPNRSVRPTLVHSALTCCRVLGSLASSSPIANPSMRCLGSPSLAGNQEWKAAYPARNKNFLLSLHMKGNCEQMKPHKKRPS